jgi:hypothetical protein
MVEKNKTKNERWVGSYVTILEEFLSECVCAGGGGGTDDRNYIARWYLKYFMVRQRKG